MSAAAPGAPVPERGVVAAFDWDGTLTRGDTLLPFLRELCGPAAVGAAALRVAPSLLAAATGTGSRDEAKARLLRRLLRGRAASTVRLVGAAYAARAVASGLRPALVDRLAWHRAAGHTTVIVSASLDAYVVPAARLLGVDATLCTVVEVGADGRCTGELLGGNCRAEEKARRLLAWVGTSAGTWPDTVELWAYGDSASDDAMLSLATRPVRLRRGHLPTVWG